MPRKMDKNAIIERLDGALDNLLVARVALGGPPRTAPVEGLDEAVASDRTYGVARRRFTKALHRLLDRGPESLRPGLLALEEAVNQMDSVSAEVGWHLGLRAGRVQDPGA